MGIVWENTTPSTELPRAFVPGSARCSLALCLFVRFLLSLLFVMKGKNETELKMLGVLCISVQTEHGKLLRRNVWSFLRVSSWLVSDSNACGKQVPKTTESLH